MVAYARWQKSKDEDGVDRDYLRCKCGHGSFYVVHEPVAAKRHTKGGTKRRTSAICGWCGHIKRLAYGARA